MQPTIPFIPDSAPFTPEQRSWLNGFLAGLFSAAPQTTAPAADPLPSLKLAVLYATQSGTAEGLARKLTKELQTKGHVVSLSSLEGYTPAALFAEKYAIFIASTYGEGEAPDMAQPFYEQLCIEHFPCCQNLSYTVLSLGDSNYQHFCKFGVDLDARLAALGGTQLCPRVDCDTDFDEPYATWKSALFQRLGELVQHQPSRTSAPTPGSTQPQLAASNAEAAPEPEDDRAPVASRERPFLARVVEKRALTATVSSKQTMHFAFDIENSGIAYEAGDACGIVPQNDPALVQELLYSLHFSGQIPVQLAKSQTTLYDALLNHLQITRLNRKMIEAYATIGQCQGLFQLLQPGHESYLEKYTYDRGLIDLIHDYPQVLHDPADLVAMLPRLAPRLYSISSSPLAHRGQIHTTVAVVRYQAHERQRGGVCSTLLADRRNTGDHLPLFIQPNRRFRLPREADAPVIMIGPGTGIAPFRAFLHERRALGSTGQNWLFFGERSAATDFLYREELEAMLRDQHLTRLDLAFSRDQQHKVYVQDRMMEQATALWSWLQNGASLYVCGDAARMAKDVDTALHTIAQQQGGLSDDGAREYVGRLREQSRYHRDVY